MDVEALDSDTDTEKLTSPKAIMMGMQARPVALPLTFESWTMVLHHPRHVARGTTPAGTRSGSTSTDIRDRRIPNSIGFWREFPQHIEAWKAEMANRGLCTSLFAERAGFKTQAALAGWLGGQTIRDENTAAVALGDYFDMVNDFNLSFSPYLEPQTSPLTGDVQVYTSPLAGFRVLSNPDVVITDGTLQMSKVGLGEVKAPWVVTSSAIKRFVTQLPFSHFGEQFVSRPCPSRREGGAAIKAHREGVRLAGALVQIFSDLVRDKRSVGFLATSEYIIYCFIPPENRGHLSIFYNRVYHLQRPWRPDTTPARCFTAQVGLATLAWVARRFYAMDLDPPGGLKKWVHVAPSKPGGNDENNSSYHPPRSSQLSHGSRPSTRSQYAPVSNGRQYCTTACLKALREGCFDLRCPNVGDHKARKFDLHSVVNDVLESIESDEMEVIGGGHSAKCVVVRSALYGHILVVKAYYQETEQYLCDTELNMYNHLAHLQGDIIPLLLGTAHSNFAGSDCRMLIMSYGGIPLHQCTANDELIINLTKCAIALRSNGVLLADSRMDNVLVNGNKVTVIDLESAYLIDQSSASIRNFESEIEELALEVKKSGDLEALLP